MNMQQIADNSSEVQKSIADTMSDCDVEAGNVLIVLAFAAAALVHPADREDFMDTFETACLALDHVLQGGGHA